MRRAVLVLTLCLLAGRARAGRGFDPTAIYKVAVGTSPQRGPADARVTIVAFEDFQCPFCVRAQGAVESMLRRYPDDVRLVVKLRPLAMHPRAAPAARAAAAAGLQGKFWPYHDLLWQLGTDGLDDAGLEAAAVRAGLDVPRWRRDKEGDAARKVVAADEAVADALGVTGTPTFFVNGRPLVGAQPVEQLDALVLEARRRADEVIVRGVAKARAYEALIKDGRAAGATAAVGAAPAVAAEAKAVPVAGAPARGPADAPVTIVEFSDFQCPYCLRAQGVLAEVRQRYGDKVRLVFRHFPLDFHADAFGAAEAAVFAQDEGKFWEVHDALFAHPKELGRDELESHAAALGIDVVRLRLALDAGRYEARVAADLDLGTQLGVTGTPAFFVNGRMISGAQPIETFARVIDEELAKAAALVKKGVPAGRVYETLVGLPRASGVVGAAVRAPGAEEVEHGLAVLSACYGGRVAQAKAALGRLKGARRAAVVKDCRALGVALE